MNRMTLLALGLSAGVALAACGSSTSKAAVSPGAQPAATTTTTKAAPKTATTKPVVGNAMTAKGATLVDANGMTLYTLTNAGKAVACTGQCATFWPPLLLASGTTKAVGAAGVTGLGTTSVTGGMQVTQNGLPLHRFSMDKAPGDTNGDGIASFGGTWYVATVVQNPASKAPANVPAATTPPVTVAPYVAPQAPAPAATPPTYSYGY